MRKRERIMKNDLLSVWKIVIGGTSLKDFSDRLKMRGFRIRSRFTTAQNDVRGELREY